MESPRGLSLRALAMCVLGLALVGPCPGGRVAARRAAIASTLHSGEYILRNEYLQSNSGEVTFGLECPWESPLDNYCWLSVRDEGDEVWSQSVYAGYRNEILSNVVDRRVS